MQHEVVVHKASVILATNESLGQYTQRLSEAIRKYAVQKLNLTSGVDGKAGFSCYMIEAYGNSAVLDVYKYGNGEPSSDKYYAVKYTRGDKGEFKFDNFTEVERVTSYQPKEGLSVTKALSPSDSAAVPDGVCAIAKSPGAGAPEVMPGWVAKSFWAGAL